MIGEGGVWGREHEKEVWTGGRSLWCWQGLKSGGFPTRGSLTARNKRAYSSWNMDAILEGDGVALRAVGPRSGSQGDDLKAQEGNYD